MSKGYQIIMVEELDKILKFYPTWEFYVSFLSWIVSELDAELKTELDNINIEIINVAYISPIPMIAVQYKLKNKDFGPIIEQLVSKLLREKPVAEFLAYMEKYKNDWSAIANRILREGK